MNDTNLSETAPIDLKEKSSEDEVSDQYDPTTNYFVKYWELWKENEIIVAKIKEKAYEIEIMSKHLGNSLPK